MYPIYTSNEFRYLEVDHWDSAAVIGNWKFNIQNNCPLTFLHSQVSDFNAWHEPGETGAPQSWVVGINGYIYYKSYGYGSGTWPVYVAAIDRTVGGEGSDTDAPFVYYMNPSDGATGINPENDIKGRIKDDGFGIDTDTVTFEVTYPGSGGPIDGDLSEDAGSSFLDYKLIFDPDDILPEQTEITVEIWADDLVGNDDTTTWSFTTGDIVGIKSVSLGELKATFK